jgi:hypothetical protein
LRFLPGQRNEQFVYRDDPDEALSWSHIAVNRIVESLRVTFGGILAQGDAGLAAMAEMLCSNTRRPFYDDFSSSEQWLDQFCGKNLRWESLGLMFAHLARVSDMLDSMRRPSLEFIDGKESLETARTSLESCIQIARYFTEANDLLLDLCRRLATLCSIVDGDAGKYQMPWLTRTQWANPATPCRVFFSCGPWRLSGHDVISWSACARRRAALHAIVLLRE